MTLPAGFGYTTIHGKYISAVLDSADPDREPDVVPLSGLTITLTPSAGGSLLKSLADPPMTIVLLPIVARTDSNGVIVGPDGQPGIVIVASDYPDPTKPWTYAVSVVGNGIPKLSFNIVAHSGETIDLTSVLEAPASGSDLSTWQALALQVSQDADRAEAAAEAAGSGGTGGTGAVSTVAGRTGDVVLAADDLTDATVTGKAVIRATDAADARTAIGAGTSSLVVGTTAGTAKAGDYRPSASDISDSTATGRILITATDSTSARTAIGAGTSNLALGTTASTAKAGNYQPAAADVSDATTVGRSVLTAATAASARAAIGAGTSSVTIGTTAGTAADAGATTTALAGKEPSLPAGGDTTMYLRGDKTWQVLPTGGGTSPTLANLPAGTLHVQRWDGVTGSQPVRDTTRTDIPVEWRQPAAPPSGGNYAVAGVDSWVVTS